MALGARVVDEVLRQIASAVVVVAELLVEVVGHARGAPRADRDSVDLDEPERGHGGSGAGDRPAETSELRAAESERAPEEVRADRDQVVLEPEQHCLVPGVPAERRLWNDPIDEDDEREGERKRVDDAGREGEAPRAESVERDPEARDAEE